MVFVHNINPVLLNLGPFQVRYYGLFYALGFVVALFMIPWLAKQRREKRITSEVVQEFVIYLIIGVVLGARIFYILFYNLLFYLADPIEMLMLWHGGLSFHGGLLGAIVATLFFCRVKKIPFYTLADLTVIPLGICLALGRVANFINGELPGRLTSLPWGVKFPSADGYRHPSQLYAALKDTVIFMILFFNRKKKFPAGFLFWNFVFLYGVLRFFVEFFRQPDSQLGFIVWGLSMGQLLCLCMVAVGGWFLWKYKKKHKVTFWQLFSR